MKTTSLADLWRNKPRLLVLFICGIVGAGIGAAGMYVATQTSLLSHSSTHASTASQVAGEKTGGDEEQNASESGVVHLPKQKWSVAGGFALKSEVLKELMSDDD